MSGDATNQIMHRPDYQINLSKLISYERYLYQEYRWARKHVFLRQGNNRRRLIIYAAEIRRRAWEITKMLNRMTKNERA